MIRWWVQEFYLCRIKAAAAADEPAARAEPADAAADAVPADAYPAPDEADASPAEALLKKEWHLHWLMINQHKVLNETSIDDISTSEVIT